MSYFIRRKKLSWSFYNMTDFCFIEPSLDQSVTRLIVYISSDCQQVVPGPHQACELSPTVSWSMKYWISNNVMLESLIRKKLSKTTEPKLYCTINHILNHNKLYEKGPRMGLQLAGKTQKSQTWFCLNVFWQVQRFLEQMISRCRVSSVSTHFFVFKWSTSTLYSLLTSSRFCKAF